MVGLGAMPPMAAQEAEGSVDSEPNIGESVATPPAAGQPVVAAADTSMHTRDVGAVSATSVEPAQSQLIPNGLPWADAHPHPQMTAAVTVELGMAELSTPDTGYGAAAAVQMEEGLAVDGKEYVVHKPATAIAPAEVDTLNTSREDISVVVELSPAASGLDQPAAAEHLNAVLGAELAAIFAQLGADTSTGCASMSTEVTRSVHRPDAVAKDGSVLAVTPQDDPETAQAAATDEGAHLLAIECVSEAADDAAAETQISSCLPAEPAQVLSQQSAAVALTEEAEFSQLQQSPPQLSAESALTGGTPGAAATSRPGASPANGHCLTSYQAESLARRSLQ
ncbi:hypothetical protein WJX77_004113 [Trebouxia sp. C0004]